MIFSYMSLVSLSNQVGLVVVVELVALLLQDVVDLLRDVVELPHDVVVLLLLHDVQRMKSLS